MWVLWQGNWDINVGTLTRKYINVGNSLREPLNVSTLTREETH